ncbi:conserved hypothetical protein [Nitrosomonas nitrosa]|uniref:AAA+ ATPase domain-containing protein n=1 Tax=Nitrosomonas nitrosa TaxID=52442 RepID=A0A8H8Z1U0_9PROT|nr:AAA family ATPase [Nitrosomonas nitrosa]CAE6503403.1 conserved hypothetical protein [Nitrosomonas nitrosa]
MNMNQDGISVSEVNEKQPNYSQQKEIPNRSTSKPVMREDAIAARISAMLDAGVRISRMAIESNVTREALEAWIKGKRSQEVSVALSTWITLIDEDIAERDGDFFMSPSAKRFLRAFEHAREPKGGDGHRGIAMIYGASGTGKSVTAKWAARMDDNVVYVQADGERRTWTALLKGVVEVIKGSGYPTVGEKLRDIILRNIKPGGLLIFDHAQLIRLAVMEQLLVFPDEHGVALAFIGNTKGYKALVDAKLAQITSRIRGSIVFVEIPSEDDVDALMEARGVGGRKEREFCLLIGCQDGGLRFLDTAILEAKKIAHAAGIQKLDIRLLKLGAVNAGCWGG